MSKASHPYRFPLLLLAPWLIAAPALADNELNAVVRSFERDEGYVKPLATLFGSMTNSGWYQSASVGKLFGFYLGVPMNLTYIADADRARKVTHVDQGCRNAVQDGGDTDGCTEVATVSQPTILGRKSSTTLYNSDYDYGSKQVVQRRSVFFSDGMPEIAAFNWFPFLSPQLGVSFYHTELKLRYIGAPVPEFSFGMPAVGIQHDLSSFLPPIPIPLPISISLAGNMTWFSAEWEPGGGIDGKIELNGVSHFLGLLVGYNMLGRFEVFAEAGWERATFETGGDLVLPGENGAADEPVKPNLNLVGRNGFRAALTAAMNFGYHASVSQNVGANLGHNVNVIGYKFRL